MGSIRWLASTSPEWYTVRRGEHCSERYDEKIEVVCENGGVRASKKERLCWRNVYEHEGRCSFGLQWPSVVLRDPEAELDQPCADDIRFLCGG